MAITMAITFEVYNAGAWVDLSDYVIGCSPVPYIERNRDWEVIASEFNIIVSQKTNQLTKGDKILFKQNSAVFFSGYISAIEEEVNKQSWRVSVNSQLLKLRDYLCDYSTLFTDISSNGNNYEDYCPAEGDILGFPNVKILYLLQRMFTIAGLTLDDSGIEDSVLFNKTFTDGNHDVLIKDLRIDEKAMYAINQAGVVDYTHPSKPPDKASKITFLDFLKIFCSACELFIVVTADLSFKFYRDTVGEVYIISDDNQYSYSTEDVSARESDYVFEQKFGHHIGANHREKYNQTATIYTPVIQETSGNGIARISWYTNLFYLIKAKNQNNITNAIHSGGTVTVTIGTHDWEVDDYILIEEVLGMTDLNGQHKITAIASTTIAVSLTTAQSYISAGIVRWAGAVYGFINDDIFLFRKKREIIEDYTKEKIKTDVDLTIKGVVRNFVDVESRPPVSIIIQEIYGFGAGI